MSVGSSGDLPELSGDDIAAGLVGPRAFSDCVILLDRLAEEADCTGLEFRNCAFVGPALAGLDFSGSRFANCTWRGTRISGAAFIGCTFSECLFYDRERKEGCEFVNCEMQSASISGCILILSVFKRCNLYDVTVRDSNFRATRWQRCDFSRTFSRHVTKVLAVFEGCNFSYGSLSEVALPGCELRRCNFTGADLQEADLRDADLCGSNLEGADMANARMSGADIRRCSLSDLNLSALEACDGLKVTWSQQQVLLEAFGVRVYPDLDED